MKKLFFFSLRCGGGGGGWLSAAEKILDVFGQSISNGIYRLLSFLMRMSRSQPICSAFLLLSPPISHPSTFLLGGPPPVGPFFSPPSSMFNVLCVCVQETSGKEKRMVTGTHKSVVGWKKKKELFFLPYFFC